MYFIKPLVFVQNDLNFADNIFKCISIKKDICILVQISLTFRPPPFFKENRVCVESSPSVRSLVSLSGRPFFRSSVGPKLCGRRSPVTTSNQIHWNHLGLYMSIVMLVRPSGPYGYVHGCNKSFWNRVDTRTQQPLGQFTSNQVHWNRLGLYICNVMVICPSEPHGYAYRPSKCSWNLIHWAGEPPVICLFAMTLFWKTYPKRILFKSDIFQYQNITPHQLGLINPHRLPLLAWIITKLYCAGFGL